MKEVKLKLIAELLKNSRRSDRELAKAIGTSQPTVTRIRSELEKEGVIKEYTIIPDFQELGYQIMGLTIAKAKATLSIDEQEKAKKALLANPQVFFVASAEGMGGNGIMLSLHKSFSDFHDFIRNLKLNTGELMEKVDTMLISLDASATVKQLSLASLVRQIEEGEGMSHE